MKLRFLWQAIVTDHIYCDIFVEPVPDKSPQIAGTATNVDQNAAVGVLTAEDCADRPIDRVGTNPTTPTSSNLNVEGHFSRSCGGSSEI